MPIQELADAIGTPVYFGTTDRTALANASGVYANAAAYVVNTPQSAGRAVAVAATVAGNVSLTLSGGATIVVPVPVGLTILPFAATQVNSASTATATYTALS